MLTEGACQKHSDRTLQLLNPTIQASNKIGLFGPQNEAYNHVDSNRP
jgi:hypothetical protein